MIIVGLTGGIGSGKTTVAKEFEKLGVPIYIADEEAKKLMDKSKVIQRKLKTLFGDEAYVNDRLNRPFLAQKIFNNKDYLQQMNAIVHPKVAAHFAKWLLKQNAFYIIKEVAVLFENGSYKNCDFIITVTATIENRMERLIKRDHSTVSQIQSIMSNQWPDEKKIERSHFVINNNNLEDTVMQVQDVHKQLLKTSKSSKF